MATKLLSNLCFPEGPRWRHGRLYFSDMHAHEVVAVTVDGRRETVCRVEHQPSGLGWLPDGRMLVVSMTDRRILRLERDGSLSEHADIATLASFHCNDMVVSAEGNAYVGNFGFDLFRANAQRKNAELVLVRANGQAEVVATDLAFPNGPVITPDGKTLIVGESMAARLTAFDIAADGRLSNRRVWAQLPQGTIPDGICLDAEGCIWVASPPEKRCVRVRYGGAITDSVSFDQEVFACTLGGDDMKTLFVLTAGSSNPEQCRQNRDGHIQTERVSVAGTGSP